MSKFNAKNLSYESNEPSFLRKLRGEYGDANAVRHERPLARPRKGPTNGDDDDQPTYVVEGSQDTLSKQEYEAMMRNEEDNEQGKGKPLKGGEAVANTGGLQKMVQSSIVTDPEPAKDQVAAIGGAKKKRHIIAIGADDKEDDQRGNGKQQPKAKKGKKVKLSFDETS